MMTPYWPDLCRHTRPNDRFLGTFNLYDGVYDVFVYQDNALSSSKPDMHVCIRYGDKGDQYISPGNVKDFVDRFVGEAGAPEAYQLALPFIQKWLKQTHKQKWLKQTHKKNR
jgi:hypothetical protein